MAHWSPNPRPVPPTRIARASPRLALAELSAVISAALTGLLIAVGFAFAIMFAATLAIVLVLAISLFGLAALAWRIRPRPGRLEFRRPGHAWVAYRWDDSRR